MRGINRKLVPRARPGSVRPKPGPPSSEIPAIIYPLVAGPYQNNGATQWYARVPIGTPGQTMKIALDTGSNFIWVTSTLCGPDGCSHYGNRQFNYADSSTFEWIDQTQQTVSFGPWGEMKVETGSDVYAVPGGDGVRETFFLAAEYSGSQFEQLDWDGGLGIPSGSDFADPSVSFLIEDLMNQGLLDPRMPYISFQTDQASNVGTVTLGGYDLDGVDLDSALFMRWSPYLGLAGVEYLWSTALAAYKVGDQLVAHDVEFCLDSGSSQFKGDVEIMLRTLELVSGPRHPDVELVLGTNLSGDMGRIVVPPSVYRVTIEAGPDEGETLPQFNPLDLPGLVLVGSVLMDHLYTIFEYGVTATAQGYHLTPVGMWAFNKRGGPKLIQSRATGAPRLGPKQPLQG